MAQALYGDHPLQDYLKESGDRHDRVPGSYSSDAEEEPEDLTENPCVDLELEECISPLLGYLETLRQLSTSIRKLFPSPNDDFAERFKYDLISSNLLSDSVSSTPLLTSRPILRIRRSDSLERALPGGLQAPQLDAVERTDQAPTSLSSAFVLVGLAALLNHHFIAAFLALITSFSFTKSESTASKQKHIVQVFEALAYLRDAGNAWDAAVNDAIVILEREERNAYHTPYSYLSSMHGPSSALRIALHSTLITTQHQCDNIRPLLATLASPAELAQLSEMYAPPSPVKPTLSLPTRPPTFPRRNSFSGNDVEARPSGKRQTWSGINDLQIGSNGRSAYALRRRDRRRSDIANVFGRHASTAPTIAVPTPPETPLKIVSEVDEDQNVVDLSMDERDFPKDNFGTAALSLRRNRRKSGADMLGLGLPPLNSTPAMRSSSNQYPLSALSSSRFTSMHINRHPLSMSALHHALHSALASRRYACSHLLALRFNEDAEDESYWENVRGVTALLTSTFEDAAARLNEALAVADAQSRKDAQPTPESSPGHSPQNPLSELNFPTLDPQDAYKSPPQSSPLLSPPEWNLPPTPVDGWSFAPTRSSIVRFGSHVDAMSASIREAQEHLQSCVKAMREGELDNALPSLQSDSLPKPEATAEQEDQSEQAVLDVYESLRRELGHAFRECERGKCVLLEVFEARKSQKRRLSVQLQDDNIEGEESTTSSPPFRLVRKHTESDSSGTLIGEMGREPFTPEKGSPIVLTLLQLSSEDPAQPQTKDLCGPVEDDDATQHLLLNATPTHLPPPGIEQVFESDSVPVGPFKRDRSKLSREERIKLMRTKRESMIGRGLAAQLENDEDDNDGKLVREKWGPSTDVVEELKDVIWKVGERRRKMIMTGLQQHQRSVSPSLIPRRPESTSPMGIPSRRVPSSTSVPSHGEDTTTTSCT